MVTHSVDETVQMLEGILKAKGVRLFALIDHSGEAEKAGMKMRPAKLLIFGNPRRGMVCRRTWAPISRWWRRLRRRQRRCLAQRTN